MAFALKGEEDVAQFTKRAVGADFCGARGAFEDAGNFGKREFLETAEQQDLAVIVMQATEGNVEQGVFVAGSCTVAGVRGGVSVSV